MVAVVFSIVGNKYQLGAVPSRLLRQRGGDDLIAA
jgi:hypothetical protein